MNVLNLNYANMVKEAQEELNKIWVPNIGDLAIDESGMVGVIINRDKQEIRVDPDNVYHAYVGVSLVHNNKVWQSHNPIWMPRLGQIAEFDNNSTAQQYVMALNRWVFTEDANYTYAFGEMEEVAFAHYMDKEHNKLWNFAKKQWKVKI